jgi:8-oxo-dGTP pyrophosphatase MutT (NUDIX family)
MIGASNVAAIRQRLARQLAAPAGRYRPLLVDNQAVGWLNESRAAQLSRFADAFVVEPQSIAFRRGVATPEERTDCADRVSRALSEQGLLTRWRDERYAVATAFGASPLFLLERAAARFFGIRTYAAHINGLVRAHGADCSMWLARRSPSKSIDPDLLDNLVGGGIAAGSSVRATVIKEAWEEAGIDETSAQSAIAVSVLHLCREQPDGLQRETIFVHDLALPPGWTPTCQDDEVAEHRLVTLAQAAGIIANEAGRDVVTADASLVIADCLMRHGAIAADSGDYLPLDELRHPLLDPPR